MKKLTFLVLVLCLLPALLVAQVKNQMDPDNVEDLMESSYYDYQRTSGFLGFDPSKVKMSHNYTLSFGAFGDQSITQGMYLNTISYQFSAPLSMRLQWGFVHQPFASGISNNLTSQLFLSGAELKYQPTKTTTLKLQFRQYPRGSYSPYYNRGFGWQNQFDRDPWFDEE